MRKGAVAREGYKKTELGWIPEDWEVKRLGECIDLEYGKSQSSLKKGDYPIIGTSGICGYGDQFLFSGESIIIGRKGTIDKPFFINQKFWVIDTAFYITRFTNCQPLFLFYNLGEINWRLYNEASGVPSLNRETIKLIKIPLPPLPEQKKIAEILSTWDEAIEKLNSYIEAKKKLKKALMQKLLTGKQRFKEFIVREGYKKTELGWIPEDWEVKRLGELAEIKRGASPRPIADPKYFDINSKVGWVRISDVSKSKKYLLSVEQYLSELGIKNSRFVPQNSLIMSICASIGKPICTQLDTCIHDGFVVFESLLSDQEFLYYYLLFIQNTWHSYSQPGTQLNLNTDIINIQKLPLPPLPEQKKIAEILSKADEEIDLLKQELEKLKTQKKGLMQKLLTGAWRVKL